MNKLENTQFEIFHKFSYDRALDEFFLSPWLATSLQSIGKRTSKYHLWQTLEQDAPSKSWWGQLPWLQNVGHLLSRTTGFGLSITLCCDSPAWSGDQTALSTPAMLKQCQPPRLPKSAPFDLVHYPPRTTALGCVSAREGLLDSAIPTGVTCLNDLQLHYFVDPSILYYTVCNDIQCSNLVWN